jgi:hypothetical protein
MVYRAETVDQRQYNRFRVPKRVFVALRSHDVKVGQVIDMSVDGLAFSYIPREELSSGPFELQVFFADNVYVYRVPFKTIWDKEAEQLPSSTVRVRRCGVQFGEMAPHHISQLECFVENHTIA